MNLIENVLKLKRRKRRPYVKSELLSEKSPFVITEAYKTMRTNLIFMMSDNKKVVAFTSSMAGEGKTTTCFNMGIAFSQTGKKTLIIDMDMRKPRAHRYFDIPSTPGVSDYLCGFSSQIPVVETKYENLYVIPIGTLPPAPPELLMSTKVEELLNQLREEYDYIFIDTPPVHVVTDTSIIANKVDGVVFIVRENAVSLDFVKDAVKQLENVGTKIFGFILNGSYGDSPFAKYKYRSRYQSRYRYNYGYGYGYGYGFSSEE